MAVEAEEAGATPIGGHNLAFQRCVERTYNRQQRPLACGARSTDE
jgi:hypothetical protein